VRGQEAQDVVKQVVGMLEFAHGSIT
jgi:hypothetical protein